MAQLDLDELVCSQAQGLLLGVVAKHLAFSGGTTSRAVAGINLHGMGENEGGDNERDRIKFDRKKVEPDELREAGVRSSGSMAGSTNSGRKARSTTRQADLDEEIPAE